MPQRHLRVFRDESDFQGTEYQAALDGILQASAKLVVICSPSSRSSPYVGGEIARFATLRGKENIVPVLLAGIPNNESSAIDDQRSFHDELVSRLPVPLASDYRGWKDKRDRIDRDRFESGWYKLLADIYEGYGVEPKRHRAAGEAASATNAPHPDRRGERADSRARLLDGLGADFASGGDCATQHRPVPISRCAIDVGRTYLRCLDAACGGGATNSADIQIMGSPVPRFAAATCTGPISLRSRFNRERNLLGRSGTCAAAWTEDNKTVVWTLASEERQFEVPRRAMPDHLCRSLFVSSAAGGLERRPFDPSQKAVWSVRDAVDPPTAWRSIPATRPWPSRIQVAGS